MEKNNEFFENSKKVFKDTTVKVEELRQTDHINEGGRGYGVAFFIFAILALIFNIATSKQGNNKIIIYTYISWGIASICLIAWIAKAIVNSNTKDIKVQLNQYNQRIIELQKQIDELKKGGLNE